MIVEDELIRELIGMKVENLRKHVQWIVMDSLGETLL
jgi:hypothetical protein